MTDDEVDQQFQQLTQPRATRIAGMVVAWAVALGVVACVALGVIALAKVVF